MKIAVTYKDGQVFQHFGHTDEFKIYNVENNKIVSTEILDSKEYEHGAVAGFISKNNIDLVICGDIGDGAQSALKRYGIDLRGGCAGNADEQVEAFLRGELRFNPDVTCDHDEAEHHRDGNGKGLGFGNHDGKGKGEGRGLGCGNRDGKGKGEGLGRGCGNHDGKANGGGQGRCCGSHDGKANGGAQGRCCGR